MSKPWEKLKSNAGSALIAVLGVTAIMLFLACASPYSPAILSTQLPILDQWQGDFPVSQLHLLPENQRDTKVGYLGDAGGFAAVWQAFMPSAQRPDIDFERHLVVFVRNKEFYNNLQIGQMWLKTGTVEVVAMETMSSKPIDDKVFMALALIARGGVKTIQIGKQRIDVH